MNHMAGLSLLVDGLRLSLASVEWYNSLVNPLMSSLLSLLCGYLVSSCVAFLRRRISVHTFKAGLSENWKSNCPLGLITSNGTRSEVNGINREWERLIVWIMERDYKRKENARLTLTFDQDLLEGGSFQLFFLSNRVLFNDQLLWNHS